MIPARDEALALLIWAGEQNPGRWVEHSMAAARAAYIIAQHSGMDADKAYIFGLLHDIGRYEGVRNMHHLITGRDLMNEKGWPEVGRICITHSFPDGNAEHYFGVHDVTDAEYDSIRRDLRDRPFDDYDRLIQLCDAIVYGKGVCLLEKRIVNVVLRYGACDGLQSKWLATFELKRYFDHRTGGSIYDLFPEAPENTFDREYVIEERGPRFS